LINRCRLTDPVRPEPVEGSSTLLAELFNWRLLMKHTLTILLTSLLLATAAGAATKESDKDTKEDIARHRAIAAAHEGAAKCREAGKGEEVCLKELQAACKGLAIGKYCGMKHEH
jgi:hypothetical protein